jgi:hypothetical protein
MGSSRKRLGWHKSRKCGGSAGERRCCGGLGSGGKGGVYIGSERRASEHGRHCR